MNTPSELLLEVQRRGLTAYFWDGTLHLLPARLAAANADLHAELLANAKAICRELESLRANVDERQRTFK